MYRQRLLWLERRDDPQPRQQNLSLMERVRLAHNIEQQQPSNLTPVQVQEVTTTTPEL